MKTSSVPGPFRLFIPWERSNNNRKKDLSADSENGLFIKVLDLQISWFSAPKASKLDFSGYTKRIKSSSVTSGHTSNAFQNLLKGCRQTWKVGGCTLLFTINNNSLPIFMVPRSSTVTLSWLCPGSKIPVPPSFIQKRVGAGFPAAMQSSLALAPCLTLVSLGLTRSIGGAERRVETV